MPGQYDFKKEWKKTRIQLTKLSKEAVQIAKKGEKELIELSRKSKIHVDTTALTLKKERLYYMIGKEYAGTKAKNTESAKLKKLVNELNKTSRQQKQLQQKLKKTADQ